MTLPSFGVCPWVMWTCELRRHKCMKCAPGSVSFYPLRTPLGGLRLVSGPHLRLLRARSQCCIYGESVAAPRVKLSLAPNHQRQTRGWTGRKSVFSSLLYDPTSFRLPPSLAPVQHTVSLGRCSTHSTTMLRQNFWTLKNIAVGRKWQLSM